MTEIRPIHESEGETFLALMCNVFGLEFNRAYDVFFNEPYFDLDRKWALFEGREMVSILTTTPLEFGWGRAIWIAGVATRENRRGEGHASRLLQRVLRDSDRAEEGAALLFAQRSDVYERNGFEPLVQIVRGEVRGEVDESDPGELLDPEFVEAIYADWAAEHPDRLRRDAQRWAFWRWNYRLASEIPGGYLCYEPSVVREAIGSSAAKVLAGVEWFGSTLVADELGLQFSKATIELTMMGYRVPGVPQMFMTDQF
jgi:GNAT superfamily N-acetyltransferase